MAGIAPTELGTQDLGDARNDGGAAVISWDSGWTSKIAKSGDKYVKTTFKKGEPLDGKPAGTSDAVKK